MWIGDILKNDNLIQKHADYFKRELEIIEPKLIVIMGDECAKLFTCHFKDTKFEFIWHYAYPIAYNPKMIPKYMDKMEKIKNKYDALAKIDN